MSWEQTHALLIPLIKLLPGPRLPRTQLWKLLAFVTCTVEGMRADTTNKHGDPPAHGQAHACIQILSLSLARSLSGAGCDLPDMKIWRKAAISLFKVKSFGGAISFIYISSAVFVHLKVSQ